MRSKNTLFNSIIIGICILFLGAFFAFGQEVIPQEIGFKDVAFKHLNKEGCQNCHGTSQVDDHHGTQAALTGDCSSCHKVSTAQGNVGVALERNCMACHQKSPHHKTEAATAKECGSCHDSVGVSAYSNDVPVYKPSNVTPTVEDCKTCHAEGTIDGVKVMSIKDTHHGISLSGCNVCHDENDKKSNDIRICERCHSVKALHEVIPHVKKENCVKCHAVKKAAAQQ